MGGWTNQTGVGSVGSAGPGHHVGVDGAGRCVRDVGEGELAHPAGELEQDAVGVLEVDAAHVDAGVHGVADAPLGVVVVGDLGAVDARGDETVAVFLDLLGRHVEGNMVHGPDGARQVALIRSRCGCADAGHAVGCVGEPEEGEAVAAAAVEEEVLTHAGRQLDGLDQRHAEHVRVEVDRLLHVAAHEGEMVDAPQLESAGAACHDLPSPLDAAPTGIVSRRSWSGLRPYDAPSATVTDRLR